MPISAKPSLNQLKRAIQLSERIEALHGELSELISEKGQMVSAKAPAAASKKRGRGAASSLPKPAKGADLKNKFFSEKARAHMSAGQRARWARERGEKVPPTNLTLARQAAAKKKVKRKFNAQWRKKLAAAARRRWANARAGR